MEKCNDRAMTAVNMLLSPSGVPVSRLFDYMPHSRWQVNDWSEKGDVFGGGGGGSFISHIIIES